MGMDAKRSGRFGLVEVIDVAVLILLGGSREQPARDGDVVSAGAAGEQAVMANAMESGWQHVHEKRRMNSAASRVIVLVRSRPSSR